MATTKKRRSGYFTPLKLKIPLRTYSECEKKATQLQWKQTLQTFFQVNTNMLLHDLDWMNVEMKQAPKGASDKNLRLS